MKETITNQDNDYSIGESVYKDSDKMAYYNYSPDNDKINFIVAHDRDANNIFIPLSSLIIGTSTVIDFSIVDNKIYLLGNDDYIYEFDY